MKQPMQETMVRRETGEASQKKYIGINPTSKSNNNFLKKQLDGV